ncbi:MAG: DUF2442 domain-containing protein [Treponema sp.]|nr:DUF2442 domain-containing protein [Treponema sp.]
MSFSKENAKAKRVWFDDLNMWILFEDGRQLSIPKFYFESLKNASMEELNNYELLGGGLGIHWEELDEDLYVPNLLISVPSQEIA